MTSFQCVLNYKAKGPFTFSSSRLSPVLLDQSSLTRLGLPHFIPYLINLYSHLVKIRYGLLFAKSGPSPQFTSSEKFTLKKCQCLFFLFQSPTARCPIIYQMCICKNFVKEVIFISYMVFYCTKQKVFFLFPAPILCKTKVPDHRRSSQAKAIKMLEVCFDFLAVFI